jgi:hypothetical protein
VTLSNGSITGNDAKVVMFYSEVQKLPGEDEENHKKSQSGQAIIKLRSEPRISQIHC